MDCVEVNRPLGIFKGEEHKRAWRNWEEVDLGDWTESREENGKVVVIDQALEFFSKWNV